jgi:hypothetical protein
MKRDDADGVAVGRINPLCGVQGFGHGNPPEV